MPIHDPSTQAETTQAAPSTDATTIAPGAIRLTREERRLVSAIANRDERTVEAVLSGGGTVKSARAVLEAVQLVRKATGSDE